MPSVSSVFENGNPRVTIKPGWDSATVTAGATGISSSNLRPLAGRASTSAAGEEFGRTAFRCVHRQHSGTAAFGLGFLAWSGIRNSTVGPAETAKRLDSQNVKPLRVTFNAYPEEGTTAASAKTPYRW